MSKNCATGSLRTATGESTVERWSSDRTHVGFIVRRGGRPIAAIDTDHQWVRPVWVDQSLSEADLVAIDALGYVLNDLLEAEEDVGFPMLCGELSWSRRWPR